MNDFLFSSPEFTDFISKGSISEYYEDKNNKKFEFIDKLADILSPLIDKEDFQHQNK